MAAGVCCPYAADLPSAVTLPSKPKSGTLFLPDILFFVEPLILNQEELQEPPIYFCPEYDVDFVGNDIAYAAGTTSWQSCGEFSYCPVVISDCGSICTPLKRP